MKKKLLFLSIMIVFFLLYSLMKKEETTLVKKENKVKKNVSLKLKENCPFFNMKWNGVGGISQLFWGLNSLKSITKIEDLSILPLSTKKLKLTSLRLKQLPGSLFKLKNIEELDISDNKFDDIEAVIQSLSKLSKLKILKLEHCGLEFIPNNIAVLSNLKGISLGQNKLINIGGIEKLENLRYLSLRRNKTLKDLSPKIGGLKCLQLLDISGTGLERLRDEISKCENLISILGNASKIKNITEEIGNLKRLQNLNLGANSISLIPETIGDLNSLKYLELGSNELEKLPESISRLEGLDRISLEYNRFKEFPNVLLKLKKLRQLNLHNNYIYEIPLEVTSIPGISLLYVDHEVISDDNINKLRQSKEGLEVKKHDALRRANDIKRKK